MGKIIRSKHFLVLLLSAVLRLFFLARVPPALNWDEVSMGYTAYSLSVTGADEWGSHLPLFFRSYGEWKSPVYIYLLVPFIKVFGLNAWGVRLPAAIMGVLAVYLTYLIGTKLYGKKIGLWSSLLLAVSPWHIMLSRPGFEAGVSLTLVLSGIYSFLKLLDSLEDKNQKNFILYTFYFILTFGLAPYTYNSAKIVVPGLVLVLLYLSRKTLKLKKILVFLGLLGIFALPLASDIIWGQGSARYSQVGITTDSEAVEQFYKFRRTLPLPEVAGKIAFNKYTFLAVKSFSNWTSYLSPHFLLGSSSIRPQHSIPYRGVLYFTEFFLVIIGLYALRKQKGIARYLPISLIFLGFIPPALTKDPYHVLRSILTLPSWQLLAAIGVSQFRTLHKRVFGTLLLVLTCEIAIFLIAYFAWYPKAFARDWQVGYKEVVSYLVEHQGQYDRVIFTKAYGEPQVFVAFYSKMDPHIIQGAADKLLDYERLGYPWEDQMPEYSIGKYTYKDMEWDGGKLGSRTLYVGKGDDFWSDTPILYSVDFPDGSPAFRVVEGKD